MDNKTMTILAKYSEYPYRTFKTITTMAVNYQNSKEFNPAVCTNQIYKLLPGIADEDLRYILGYIAIIALDKLQWKVAINHCIDPEQNLDEVKQICVIATFAAMQKYKLGTPVSNYFCTAMMHAIAAFYRKKWTLVINAHDQKLMAKIIEYDAKHGGHVNVELMAKELKIKLKKAQVMYRTMRINHYHDDELSIDAYANIPSIEETYQREIEEMEFNKNLAEAALAVFSPEIAYAITLFSHVKSINQMKPHVLRFRLFTKYLNEELNGDNQEFANRVIKGLCVSDVCGLREFIKTQEEANIVKNAFFKADNDLKAINDGIATEESCLGDKLNLNYKLSQIFGTTKNPRTINNAIAAKKFKKELELKGLSVIAARIKL